MTGTVPDVLKESRMLLSCGAEGSIAVRLPGCDSLVCRELLHTSNTSDDSSASSGSEKGHGASVLLVGRRLKT